VFIFFNLETKKLDWCWGRRGLIFHTEGGKAAGYLENVIMSIVKIDLAQQKDDHSALC
jgi:hypothetical protein